MANLGFKEMTPRRVGQIGSNANFGEISDLLDEGRSMDEICDILRIDMPLACETWCNIRISDIVLIFTNAQRDAKCMEYQ